MRNSDYQSNDLGVGIDAMSFYVPSIFLDLETFASSRKIDYQKLNKGLGLEKMALPDTNEDAASMAANAVWKLIKTYDINPKDIGRLYVGTESGLDGAKPIATYVLGMLNARLQEESGQKEEHFSECDALDMTFACIGGVDALQNTLDWARGNDERMGIVVCTDYAKYDKFSGGEYTQGAGAVAMLIKSNPRLMAIRDVWGVSTKSEHDFFKPNFRETPVFDGQFSNFCYQNRLGDAYFSFKRKAEKESIYLKKEFLSECWNHIVFHLPYAFQGKRMFKQVFLKERTQNEEEKKLLLSSLGLDETASDSEIVKAIGKSKEYNEFVEQKISDGQRASSIIGNMYTASIFMSLMSCLEANFIKGEKMEGQTVGFCAYGSGSKSKVFEGVIQKDYKKVIEGFHLFSTLALRTPISLEDYENLHDRKQLTALCQSEEVFVLADIQKEPPELMDARIYKYQ